MKRTASGSHTFIVGTELMEELVQLARRHERSKSYFVRLALRRLLDESNARAGAEPAVTSLMRGGGVVTE
jgi:predicted DNA-binding protein